MNTEYPSEKDRAFREKDRVYREIERDGSNGGCSDCKYLGHSHVDTGQSHRSRPLHGKKIASFSLPLPAHFTSFLLTCSPCGAG